jgi:hypothetical protein
LTLQLLPQSLRYWPPTCQISSFLFTLCHYIARLIYNIRHSFFLLDHFNLNAEKPPIIPPFLLLCGNLLCGLAFPWLTLYCFVPFLFEFRESMLIKFVVGRSDVRKDSKR